LVRLTFLNEADTGVINHEGEFSVRRGFDKGAYVAVLAHETGGELMGAFRACRGVTPHHLDAAGTWVHPHCRRAGLGLRLWARMLRETQPRSVFVKTISGNGARLVRALKRRYPKIKWEHRIK
jgi:GNAT superfamily N-acetyltransferase